MKRRLFAAVLAAMLLLSSCESNTTTSAPQSPNESAADDAGTPAPIVSETPGRDILALAEEIEFDPENYADIVSNVPYIDDGKDWHLLDLYGTQSSADVAPTVIEVHGGGFISGSKENNADHCIFFAERGYKVIAPEYGKIPDQGDFKSAIQELFAVFHWAEDNADVYGFDLNNLFLSGDSAGGYYTLLCCAIFYSPELQEYFGVTLPGFQFNAYVTSCPRTEVLSIREALDTGEGPAGRIAQTIGKELLMDDDLMEHMDLTMCVAPEAFSGLFMNTTPGDINTGAAVLAFDSYLTENGVDHTMISYDGVVNELAHTFNISYALYPESKVANQDMTDYINDKLR